MYSKNHKNRSFHLASIRAIFKKEILYLMRNPPVVTFAILFPMLELFIFGYCLDINVRQVNTVIYDLAKTQDSSRLIDKYVSTNDFRIIKMVTSDDELYDMLVSGKAKVGIKIPVDYSQNLIKGTTARVQVLVDGSDATVTTEIINTSDIVTLQESVQRLLRSANLGSKQPVDPRISVLFNPSSRSANFYLPGLLIFEMPSIAVFLVALSIAAEREKGTLEQLRMTPINYTDMAIGKIIPYGILAFLVLCILVFSMRFILGVPINGSPFLLLALVIPFIGIGLGFGMLVATVAKTQLEAFQMSILIRVIPTLYLSGFLFPIESMPNSFQFITKFLPDRYAVEVCRAIILRGNGIEYLWFHALVLYGVSIFMLVTAITVYRRKLKENQ